MVTVVNKRDLGGNLGNAVMSGIGGAQNIAQQNYQRHQLQSAFKQAREEIQPKRFINAEGKEEWKEPTPSDTLFSLINATAGIPGSEKYIGPAFQELNAERGRRASSVGTPGQEQSQQPMSSESRMSQANTQLQSIGIQPPEMPTSELEGSISPTHLGAGPIPQIFTPQDQSRLREDAARQGRDPNLVQKATDDYNEAARAQIDDMRKASDIQASVAQKRTNQQQTASDEFRKMSPELDQPQFNTFMRISQKPEIQKLDGLAKQHDATKRLYNIYDKSKYEMTRLAQTMSTPEDFDRSFKTIKNTADTMVKNGMRDEAEGLLKEDLNLGPVNVAEVLNNLPQDVYRQADSLPDYGEYTRDILSLPEFAPSSEYEKAEAKRIELDKKFSTFVEKNFKPGKYDNRDPNSFKQGTSLLLLRDIADKKGMPWRQFGDLVNNLTEQGKIQLDDKQKSELLELGRSPEELRSIPELLYDLGSFSEWNPKRKSRRK